MSNNILVIRNGLIKPSIDKYIPPVYQITYVRSKDVNVETIDIDSFNMVMILGGHQSVLEIQKYPELNNVLQLITKCAEQKKVIIGFCLGCQIIAHAFGQKIKKMPACKVGYDVTLWELNNIFRCHTDFLASYDDIVCIHETYENIPYIFQIKNCFGVQCHPDIAPESIIRHHPDNSCREYAKKNSQQIHKTNSIFIKKLFDLIEKHKNS